MDLSSLRICLTSSKGESLSGKKGSFPDYHTEKITGGYVVKGVDLTGYFNFEWIEDRGWYVPNDKYEEFVRYMTILKLRRLSRSELQNKAKELNLTGFSKLNRD